VHTGFASLPSFFKKLARAAFSTRSPYKLSFTGDERGSRVYICLRWENTRGEKGPWSAISSAVVP
jgi:hypothetical protein